MLDLKATVMSINAIGTQKQMVTSILNCTPGRKKMWMGK
jgi:hypothetical protein